MQPSGIGFHGGQVQSRNLLDEFGKDSAKNLTVLFHSTAAFLSFNDE